MEYNSIYRAVVTNNLDPEKRGRIKVQCPLILGEYESNWCIPCYPMTGFSSGFFYLPDLNAPVWILFEEGNPDKPVWIGGWSIPTLPPPIEEDIREQENNPRELIVEEDLLPTNISKDLSLLNDFYGWITKLGGVYWQHTLDNKDVFEISLKDMKIRGEISKEGTLTLSYKKSKIVIKENTIDIMDDVNNIKLKPEGVSINSEGNINLSAKGNINIKGSKINLN